MRIIKFRAWDTTRRVMVGSDYDKNWGDNADEWYADVAYMELTGIQQIAGNPYYKVMQFTGLKDRKGKEIYEGDVIKTKWAVGKVHFHPNGYWDILPRSFPKQCSSQDDAGFFALFSVNGYVECEVIGNIYENPDY